MIANYTIEIRLTRPVDRDDDPQAYLAPAEKRSLEREILQCLRRLHGDCDYEVMDATLEAEADDEPRDEEYERAAARDRLHGFARTGGKDWT